MIPRPVADDRSTDHIGTNIFIDRHETYRICNKAVTGISALPIRADDILLEVKAFIPGLSEEDARRLAWKAQQAALLAVDPRENGPASRPGPPSIHRPPPSIPPQPTMPRTADMPRRLPPPPPPPPPSTAAAAAAATRPSIPHLPDLDLPHRHSEQTAQPSIHVGNHRVASNALPGSSREGVQLAPIEQRHAPRPASALQPPQPAVSQHHFGPTNTRGRPPNPNRPPIPLHPNRLAPIALPPPRPSSTTTTAHRVIDSPGLFPHSPTYSRLPPPSPALSQPPYRPHTYSAVTKDMVIPPFRGGSATPSSKDGKQGSPKVATAAEHPSSVGERGRTGAGDPFPARPPAEESVKRPTSGAYDPIGR